MTKARDLANLISTGAPLADGTIAVAEVTGAAPLASPTFTGTPSAPTATTSTNTTQIATTAFVKADIANLVDSSPDALNTLNELAAALGDDANFSTTVTNNIATKAPLASPTFTGTATVPTLNATTALQAGGTNVITASRQLANIASVDATTVAALSAAGVGGGGAIELTTSESVVEGDTLAWNFTTGKVEKVGRVGGLGSSTGDYVYDSSQSSNLQIYDLITIPSINKIAILGVSSSGQTTIMVGEVNPTGAALTWGTSWYGDSGGTRGGAKLVYDASASRLVALYKKSNGDTIGRLFSISGNNVTNEGATTLTQTTVTMSENETQIAAVYSPTHQRIIVAWCRQSVSDVYRITVGNVGSSSISWSSDQGPDGGYLSNGGSYIKNVGIAVNGSTIVFCGRQASNGANFAYAATMSGSTLTFGNVLAFNIGNQQNVRGQVFHVSHSNQNSNRFAYGGQSSSNDSVMYHFDVSGTSISNANNYTLNGSSGSTNGFAYAYDPSNDRTYVFSRYIYAQVGSDPSDMRQSTSEASNITIHNNANTLIRACEFDSYSKFVCLIGAQNPTRIYRYALQTDNYYYFIGTALEAASANTTVKIANAGNIATGLSGLTAGRTYQIRYDGTWTNYGNAITQPTSFVNESQRARINGVALTTSTMLMVNDFMSYN